MQKRLFIALILATITASCAVAPKTWVSQPPLQTASQESYHVTIEPIKHGEPFFVSFRVTITNKDEKQDLTVNWADTRFIVNGHDEGVFVFYGVSAEEVKTKRLLPDVILPGKTMVKEVGPAKLIAFSPYRDKDAASTNKGIVYGPLPNASQGMNLKLSIGEKAYEEKLRVHINSEQ